MIPEFPPEDVTATLDRDQMMEQVGVSFIDLPSPAEDPNRPEGIRPRDPDNPNGNWTDDDGNTVVRGGFGLWVTYEDHNAGDYTPLDLLQMNDGSRITTAEEWWSKRRPEIFDEVQRSLYGYMPPGDLLPSVEWSVAQSMGGTKKYPFIEKSIAGTIDISSYPDVRDRPRILATLRLPANATGSVPVIISIGTRGMEENWAHVAPEGWGICAFDPSVLQPDNGAGLTSYIIGLVNKGHWRKPDDWGSLVAMTWGIGRLIDYFESDDAVDATKIGLAGHSRWGKATIVAMAYEQRIAVSYPSCGGALGPSMIRRHWGQNLENLSWDREYHWVAGNIFQWMGPLNDGEYLPRKVENLKVDAHSLVALAAPRPVFLNGGTQDTWSDAPGTYLTGVAATPVYELLGEEGLVMPDGEPIVDKSYMQGKIGYRVHEGGHTPQPDWPAFVKFAKKHFEDQ